MQRMINWIVINSFFALTIYYGFEKGVESAQAAALVIAWITIISSFFFTTEPAQKIMKEKGRSIYPTFNTIFDISIVAAFAIYGAWITAFFYLIHYFLQEQAWEKANETTIKPNV